MRIATKFGAVDIPLQGRGEQMHPVQARSALLRGFRTEGALDAWGEGKAPFEANIYPVRFWLTASTEAQFETAKAAWAAKVGRRDKLFFNTLAGSMVDPTLYAFARLEALTPRYVPGVGGKAAPFDAAFRLTNPLLFENLGATIDDYVASSAEVTVADADFGESDDWESPRIFVSKTISASPTNFTVADWPGDLRTNRVIVRVEALGADGAVNFKVHNTTLGQYLEYTGTLTTDGVFQANAALGPNRARISVDGGVTWEYAYADTSISPLQVPLMELAPGDNVFTVTADGTPNFRVMLLAKPAYAL